MEEGEKAPFTSAQLKSFWGLETQSRSMYLAFTRGESSPKGFLCCSFSCLVFVPSVPCGHQTLESRAESCTFFPAVWMETGFPILLFLALFWEHSLRTNCLFFPALLVRGSSRGELDVWMGVLEWLGWG